MQQYSIQKVRKPGPMCPVKRQTQLEAQNSLPGSSSRSKKKRVLHTMIFFSTPPCTQRGQKMVLQTYRLDRIILEDILRVRKLLLTLIFCSILINFQFYDQNFHICLFFQILRLAPSWPVHYSQSSMSGRYMLYESLRSTRKMMPDVPRTRR